MIQVSQETLEILASSAKRGTRSLGGWTDKSSNRIKPPQVIYHHKALPFLTNEQKEIQQKKKVSHVFLHNSEMQLLIFLVGLQ